MLSTIFISLVIAIYIDLNEPNTTDISYYTAPHSILVTHIVLTTLFNYNPKTIISITDTNSTIVPSDEILLTPSNQVSTITNFRYLELQHFNPIWQTSLIPLTPCITRQFRSPYHKHITSAPVGVILTHRTAIYSRLSLGTGFSLGEGILVNTTTLGVSLGSKITLKLTKQRMIDTTVGCYSYKDGLSARVFGYIPTVQVTPRARKILYNRKKRVVIDHVWEELKPKKIMVESTVQTLCDVGTSEELQCNKKTGTHIDQYGNSLIWNNM
ncbi:conserved hypothetical protein [Candida dubliniensis CD36]|uniref:Uncharacterized protein n=1 Tax=Candida dubliniensis (strain CD36 / ATCC MYA-646 / CBS 7987 / NCPF 3949 / NRRL Y-17841) TaxID=573826 RepID=B9WJ31_CANDC|nr:conserved hypothetical protein [Candida dubliniensis CD36]CAX41251.1 conserved hypothetical protein [Candida dubliniensis CD36]